MEQPLRTLRSVAILLICVVSLVAAQVVVNTPLVPLFSIIRGESSVDSATYERWFAIDPALPSVSLSSSPGLGAKVSRPQNTAILLIFITFFQRPILLCVTALLLVHDVPLKTPGNRT